MVLDVVVNGRISDNAQNIAGKLLRNLLIINVHTKT